MGKEEEIEMELRDGATWKKWVDNNVDPYGGACVRFAEKWAEKMEAAMAEGAELEDVAENLSFKASDEVGGITMFMYGAGVSMLSQCWKHGERLRRWHNLDTQIEDEGEKANEKAGAVLNPALLQIDA